MLHYQGLKLDKNTPDYSVTLEIVVAKAVSVCD